MFCSKCRAPVVQADPRLQALCDNCRRVRLTPSEPRIRIHENIAHQIFVKKIQPELSGFFVVWRAKQLLENQSLSDAEGRAVILSHDLKGPTQFYWIDLEPAANWSHRAMFIGIDSKGNIFKKPALWPPKNEDQFEKLEEKI